MASSAEAQYPYYHHTTYSQSELPARPDSTSAAPAPYRPRPSRSQSPYRYARLDEGELSEKGAFEGAPLDTPSSPKSEASASHHLPRQSTSSSRPRPPSRQNSVGAAPPALQPARPSTPASHFALPVPSLHLERAHAPRRLRLYSLIKPWIPLLLYLSTSLGFLIALAFWKTQVFQGLDNLSSWLKEDEFFGFAVLFFLIFLTTFPPLPLYSTLIILSGYTWGPWLGALISYWAALTGALVVFILSRYLFRDSISKWLGRAKSIKRVVRAIEKRPKLLFLIRLAPYPYNVMNCLLAASPTLTLKTYLVCTALSLFKVIIHTSVGASIHSFARYHVKPAGGADGTSEEGNDDAENGLALAAKIVGIVLAVGIFVYLSYVARKAVNEELGDEDEDADAEPHTDEEAVAFLAPGDTRQSDDDDDDTDAEGPADAAPMSETPFRAPVTPGSAAAALAQGSGRVATGAGRGGDGEGIGLN